MNKGRYVTKRVPATTNNITTGIINFLRANGHQAWRINTEGQFVEVGKVPQTKYVYGYFRPSGADSVSDIMAVLAPYGTLLAVEVKKGKDRMKKHQKEFAQNVILSGGLHCEAKSLEQFKEFYYNSMDYLKALHHDTTHNQSTEQQRRPSAGD